MNHPEKLAASAPSEWVMRFLPLIPDSGAILDLACGSGRHLRCLPDRNQPLVGIDKDLNRVSDLAGNPNIHLHQMDLEQPNIELPDRIYAGIIVTNYLHRPLLARLGDYLSAGGVLIYETFAQGNENFGHPRNPDFLLTPNELLNIFTNQLQIVAFEQGHTETPRPAIIQRICGIKSTAVQPI